MTSNYHYEQRQKELREKFGIDKLLMTDEFRISENGGPSEPHKYAQSREAYLKKKYKLPHGLVIEGRELPSEEKVLSQLEQARGREIHYAIAGEGLREPMRFQVIVRV